MQAIIQEKEMQNQRQQERLTLCMLVILATTLLKRFITKEILVAACTMGRHASRIDAKSNFLIKKNQLGTRYTTGIVKIHF